MSELMHFGIGDRMHPGSAPLTARDIFVSNYGAILKDWAKNAPKVEVAISVVTKALATLGKKPDPEGVGPWLRGLRDSAAAALAAVKSIGPDLEGLAPLFERAHACNEVIRKAQQDFQGSPPAKIREARDALDVAQAASRECWREIAAPIEAMGNSFSVVRSFPELAAFDRVRDTCANIAHLESRKPARAMLAALEFGARIAIPSPAARLESKLVTVYAPQNSPAFTWLRTIQAELVA